MEIVELFDHHVEVKTWYDTLAFQLEQKMSERKDWLYLSWGWENGDTGRSRDSYDSRTGLLVKNNNPDLIQNAPAATFFFSDEAWGQLTEQFERIDWEQIPMEYDPQPKAVVFYGMSYYGSSGGLYFELQGNIGGVEMSVVCRYLPPWMAYEVRINLDGTLTPVYSDDEQGNAFLSLMRVLTSHLENSEAWKSLPEFTFTE